ncbi:MAG: aminotransferase class III-fold pyridoxal phosphate-dependent enzyme [Acidobacteriota bacterium]
MSVAPPTDPVLLSRYLHEAHGLSGALHRLSGVNENYLVVGEKGERHVLKVTPEDVSDEILDLEREATDCVARGYLVNLEVPQLLPPRDRVTTELRARLFRFIEGTPLGELPEIDDQLLDDFGERLGRISAALLHCDHPEARRTHRWDLARADELRSLIPLVAPERRELLEEIFHQHAALVLSRWGELPRSLIHGDLNDENLLVTDGRLSGLLDFGDVLEAPTICELAIALAYLMQHVDEPLVAALRVVESHDGQRPLELPEAEVLFPLIRTRLATSVVMAAEKRAEGSEHVGHFISEEPAWRLLEELSIFDPARIHEALTEVLEHPARMRPVVGDDLLVARRRHVGASLSVSYREPLRVVRGRGQYLIDDAGRPHLDLVNNVCHVGHCHPRVVEAGQRQMAQLNTNTRYLYDGLSAYAERLCSLLPEPLDTCFLVCSGSEANELALRLARTHVGAKDVLVADCAYHGHTSTLIEHSPYKFLGPGGSRWPEPHVHLVPVPDGYRGPHRGHDLATGQAYGDEVGRVLDEIDRPVAGFLIESLLSCGGQVVPPPGYLERAFQHVREAGGLCIVDEVQVGFARMGETFWGFELQDVVPDIVVMGKPIGNGHPMAAVVTTREIADSFDNGMEFFSTFGGNPVSCAIGMAVLDVIESEGLQEHARELGAHFLEGLRELKERHRLIGDVRGVGLFLGVQLEREGDDGPEPAPQEAAELIERVRERAILLSTDGPKHDVLKIKPPMVLNRHDVDMVLRVMDEELGAMGGS